MGSMFGSSPASLKRQLEKMKKKQLDNTSRYIYLTYVPLNSKGDKYCYSIERDSRPKKKGLLFRISVFTPVNDYNFKSAMGHVPFASLPDVVYKVVKLSKNYIELENTETMEILTVVVSDMDTTQDIKKKITKIKVNKLSNSLIEAYLTLDNKKDKDRYIKDLEGLLKVSKGYELRAIKKAIKEIS